MTAFCHGCNEPAHWPEPCVEPNDPADWPAPYVTKFRVVDIWTGLARKEIADLAKSESEKGSQTRPRRIGSQPTKGRSEMHQTITEGQTRIEMPLLPEGTDINVHIYGAKDMGGEMGMADFLAYADIVGAKIVQMSGSEQRVTADWTNEDRVSFVLYGPKLPANLDDQEIEAARAIRDRLATDGDNA